MNLKSQKLRRQMPARRLCNRWAAKNGFIKMKDVHLLQQLTKLTERASSTNIGDSLVLAFQLYSSMDDPILKQYAEIPLSQQCNIASGAEPWWELFSKPVQINRELSDIEIIQLAGIAGALHELSYAFEMVETSSATGWGGSAQTRFYLNSIYHYVSSLFLVDTSKPSHQDLPMGGTVIRAFEPLGLYFLLKSIDELLKTPFGENHSFGDAILKLRHSYLVHGTFSPKNVEYLVEATKMREISQRLKFREFAWALFHQIIILRLKILSIFTHQQIHVEEAMLKYIAAIE